MLLSVCIEQKGFNSQRVGVEKRIGTMGNILVVSYETKTDLRPAQWLNWIILLLQVQAS